MRSKRTLSIIGVIAGILLLSATFGFAGPPLGMKRTVGEPATRSPEIQRQKIEPKTMPDLGEQQKVKLIVPTRVKVENTIGAVGDTVPLKATLSIKADDKPVPGQTVSFLIANKFIAKGTTDRMGKVKVEYKVPDETGSKEILAMFFGSDKYQASSDTANIAMIQSSSKIDLKFLNPNNTYHSGSRVDLYGKLYRITDNEGIKGREILIEAQGKTVDKVASGLASGHFGKFSYDYIIPNDFTGNLKLSARFEGDSLYLGNIGDVNINVMPARQYVYFFWNSVSGQVGQTVTVNVKTCKSKTYSDNNGVSGLHIGVSLNSKRVAEGYTDANGQFNAQIKLEHDAGKYDLNVYHIGTTDIYNFGSAPGEKYMTITKSPVVIYVNGSTTARIGDKLMYTVIVHRTSTDEGIGDLPVRFQDGQLKNTSHMGSAVFFYTVPGTLGNRIISATTKETARYEAGSGAITVNVLPKNN